MKRLILVLAMVMALMAFTAATALAVFPPGPPTEAPCPPCHSPAFVANAPQVLLGELGFDC